MEPAILWEQALVVGGLSISTTKVSSLGANLLGTTKFF
jgi:hypothetical protein